MGIKYVHTNIVASDWKRLADFYINVFDCKPLKPERDLSGEWIDKMTTIDNVRIRGIHLALPGYDNGPTLEIFQYEPAGNEKPDTLVNRKGLGHTAFHVDNVESVLARVVENGGQSYGDIIKKEYKELGMLTAVYAEDPEGNLIEIQNWS